MHPSELERPRRILRFDPAVEGARHGLSEELSRQIWQRVCDDATDAADGHDGELARRRFHELAARIAARGGRLAPEVGRLTQVGVELGDDSLDAWSFRELMPRVPGRTTQVAAEARRTRTLRRMPDEGERSELPGAGDVSRAMAAWQPVRPADIRAAKRRPLDGDRAEQVREAARLYREGELAAALARGEPGLVDAVAAALHDGAILAPHPVDRFRDNARGLAAELTGVGLRLGRAAARLLDAVPTVPLGQRALAFADGWTGGAARTWTGRARGWADGVARRAMAFRDAAAAAATARAAEDELAKLPTEGGAPLPPALRAQMEALFGHRFAHVRIHTDDAAAQAAEATGARAVTLGSHIYFHRDQYAPGSEAGDRLLLHELTHVVQHDQGRLPQPTGDRVELSSPSDPAEQEARAMEARAGEFRTAASASAAPTSHAQASPRAAGGEVTGDATTHASAPAAPAPGAFDAAPASAAPTDKASTAAAPTGEAPRTGKRASPDFLGIGSAVHWVGQKVDDIENWAEDKIAGLIADVAPGLATLIKEGPGGLIKDALQPAVSSWVGSITGGANIAQVAGQIKGSFTAAFAVLEGAKAGDPKCCDTLVHGINAIREVAHAFMNNPVMDAIKGIFEKVSSIVETVTKLVIGPVFDVLKTIVGGAWTAIEKVASTIGGWINAVKNVASKAFDWVAKKLGFPSGTGEGGLLDWLKTKAIEVWDKIKQTLQPVIGPLKVVAGVLLMFTGLPEIYAIIKYGPQLVQAVQWLWENRNNPNAVKQNPGGIGGSILPKILSVGQNFVGFVKGGVSWLVDKTTAFATGALQLLGAITGIPLLDMAKGFVQSLADGVKGMQQWATGAFTSAESWLETTFQRVADFIKPYASVLCSVALAVTNPAMIPVILAGWAWQWLPDCIKPPIIDLLLDAVIGILEHLPMLPMLGPLWPLLKAGVLGFLHALRDKDPQTKIKVTNKLARIISGASPMFLLGFVKGLLKGVWDGIKMPFEAIWMVAEGIHKAGDFFVALGNEADTKAKPAAHPAAAGAPGKPAAQPMPSVPGVIDPAQAQSVVGGIVHQLNAQKPPPPPAGAGAAPAGGNANQYQQLGQEARRMGGELAGPSRTVATGFWPAVQQLFSSSGKSMSLDDLMAKLHKVWDAAKAAVGQLGAKIANMICDFLMKDEAEEQLGETIGYLVGMIAFQALLDYLSAGTWTGAMGVLSAIAKFLNWPMEFLGKAMEVLKELGGFILKGIKELGGMIAEAGAGALREVVGAFGEIGTKLGEFADELMARFGREAGAADSTAAHTLEDDAAKTAGKDARAAEDGKPGDGKPGDEHGSGETAAEKEAQKAEELAEAIQLSRLIATAEDLGEVPGPAIAISLDALEARYTWIKTYEARPADGAFDIYLIASEHRIRRVDGKVSELDNGGFRLNRKNIEGIEKIVGQPEARVLADANREAAAAELAASKSSVDRVYMGEDADQLINGTRGQALSADVVGVTRQGQYVVYEAKGMDITHGLEQLEHTASQLGPEKVVDQTLVVPERITTPGYSVRDGILYEGEQPALVAGKKVKVVFTTQ
jgi:hypothetical protein